jgi:hypothetical protein
VLTWDYLVGLSFYFVLAPDVKRCKLDILLGFSDPVSCVFATTTRDHPIHLWDATSGLVLVYQFLCVCFIYVPQMR